MRILIFSTDDFLYPAGGAEVAIGEITKRLPHIQFDFICARLRRRSSHFERVRNVSIYRIGFGIPKLDAYLLALLGYYKALTLYKRKPYDLIWVVMASYGAFSATRFKRKTKIPLLLTLQEGDDVAYILRKVRFVRPAFSAIFKEADGLQSISTFLDWWGGQMGFQGSLRKVIPNGVAMDDFARSFPQDILEKTRKSWGFSSQNVVLITSSRLVRKNGVGDIIEALPLLGEYASLVICGSGPLESALRSRVSALSLEHRVKFLGFVEHAALPQLLKAADIFIRPSLSEGLGISFLEAMAARIPVVATPVGGIPDFITDGDTGFLCRPEDPQSIVYTVRRIKSLSKRERNQVLDRAFKLVSHAYAWDTVGEEMSQMFNKLVEVKRT